MKNNLIVAVIAAASLFPLAAQAEGWYVGGSLGRTQQKLHTAGLVGTINETGLRAYGGYQVDDYFGLEAGVAGLGNSTLNAGGSASLKASTRALYAAGTAKFPIGKFFLIGKFGIAKNHIEVVSPLFKGTGKEDKSDTYLSAGAGYAFNDRLSMLVEYENYGAQVNMGGLIVKTRMLSSGVRYAF